MGRAIAWMTRNHVASNLLMLVLIIGGLMTSTQVKQEVFPEFDLDIVLVTVPYPGASPEEVEQGIVLAIEEEVRSLDGAKRVTASASEGSGTVVIELETGVDRSKALNDVKTAVDRIASLPEEAERPTVSLLSNRREVITIALYGDATDRVLKEVAEQVRREILSSPDVTYVELAGVRPPEIAVEIPELSLREHGLSLPQVASLIRNSALELPAGAVDTTSGEVLLRTAERRDFGDEFASIPVVAGARGALVTLGDIAEIRDGFADADLEAIYNGKPAVMIKAFRSGEETPIEVSDAVRAYMANADLPGGLSLAVLQDQSVMYAERVELLLRNAFYGLILVLLVLGLFLDARLAFWVTMGIPISFLGSLILTPAMDVSINMISLFAFIVTLGIVVDDAIVVGENVYEMRQRGMTRMQAAVEGAKHIAMPVTFSVLTTITAFMPMFFVPGPGGKFFRVLPAIVVCVLAISLIESLFVLPAHLGHKGKFFASLGRFFAYPFSKRARASVIEDASEDISRDHAQQSDLMRALNAPQRKFAVMLKGFIDRVYMPTVDACTRARYLTLAAGIAIVVAMAGFLASGRLPFTFLPRVETDVVTAKLSLPFGSPFPATLEAKEQIEQAARRTIDRLGGEEIIKGVFTLSGSTLDTNTGPGISFTGLGSHVANVQVFLVSSEERDFGSAKFANVWREELGELPGIESLVFNYSTGPGGQSAMEIQLSHPDIAVLEEAAGRLAGELRTYPGVKDIDDGFAQGKPQLDFEVRPEGRVLGLTARELANQVRGAFYGAEAIRQQRGRDEVKVMVRRPKGERISEFDVETMMVIAPGADGSGPTEIPLALAADVKRGRAYTSISRADGQRVITVKADVDADTTAGQVLSEVKTGALPKIVGDYRGMTGSLEGDSRRESESLASLGQNFILALIVIYALLAIPFRSYLQPFVVMSAIPFGVVGAIGGHLIMGYSMSLISIFGIVALSGIVVNDSLVLVHAANELRAEGKPPEEAIRLAGARRLRPILLTSLTTFFGLAPMIFETSVQARFLIPMALSLGFGVLFATVIILLLVPSLYLIVEDVIELFTGRRATARTAPPLQSVEGS